MSSNSSGPLGIMLGLLALSVVTSITRCSQVDDLQTEATDLNKTMRTELPEGKVVSDTVTNAVLFQEVIDAKNEIIQSDSAIIAKQDSALKANGIRLEF